MGNILVSVIVITYNSAKYVLETLESVKNQTYQNIELIISDDASKDKTLDICSDWLMNNKERFVKTELITVTENTGIPANCNRGVRTSNGALIKMIAGDDILIEDCVNIGVREYLRQPFDLLQTNFIAYDEEFSSKNLLGIQKPEFIRSFFNLNAKNQYKAFKYRNFILTPSVFMNADVFKKIMFDEEFKIIEDYNFWIMAAKSGFRFSYLDNVTVKYRVRSDSVQSKEEKIFFSEEQIALLKEVRKKYYRGYSFVINNLIDKYYIFLDRVGLNNKNRKINGYIYYLSGTFFSWLLFLYLRYLNLSKSFNYSSTLRKIFFYY